MTDWEKRFWVISPSFPPTICGVGAHTTKLLRELARMKPDWHWEIITTSPQTTGQPVENPLYSIPNVTVTPGITVWKGHRFHRQLAGLMTDRGSPDGILVQYTPHLYDRLGVNLDICRAVEAWRQAGIPVYLIAHELYVPLDRHLRHWVTGPVQRWMMTRLITAITSVFVSTPLRQQELERRAPRYGHKLTLLPVTSNIDTTPVTDDEKQALRAQWASSADEKLLLFWGKLHSSKQLPVTLSALERLRAEGIPYQALYIGPDGDVLTSVLTSSFPGLKQQVHQPGVLPEADISRYLQTVDFLLYPLDDGASTRRGALMAALQHGTPTLTTTGPSTDDLLRQCPNLHFAASSSEFGNLVLQQVRSGSDSPSPASQEMIHFFETHYTWGHIAKTLLQTLCA